jgi:RNA polymerase sigma-70 factor (sigma-E family)
MADPAEFDAFVASRSTSLLKAAWLLSGDWQRAEDLLQTALAKSYLAWRRIEPGREEAYVRRVLVTTYVTWWRRAWRGEKPTAELPDVERADGREEVVDLRLALVAVLGELSRGQRATVVLRYYCDMSEAETAEALGCSVGTVKSQAARGLARLRASALVHALQEGTHR